MEIDVRYFAAAREASGHAAERIEIPDGADLDRLAAALTRRHPALEGLALRYAVDERFVPSGHALEPGDVVALIPPVSGG